MGTTKIFDLIIRSKLIPEGFRETLASLKSIGETGFFIRQGVIAPLQEMGTAVLDFIAIANPERVERLASAFDDLGLAASSFVNDLIGGPIDELSRLVGQVTLLANLPKNLAPIYADFIEKQKGATGTAVELARELAAASQRAQDATREAALASKQEEIDFFERQGKLNKAARLRAEAEQLASEFAKEAAVDQETARAAVVATATSVTDYIDALDILGIKYADLNEEIDRFNEAQGRVAPTFQDIIAAQREFVAGITSISENRLQLEERIGERLSDLLMDQAIRRGDALEDQARRNARRLAAISSTRIEAVQQASEDLTSELADIDSESARDRIRIEQGFQERIRQIKNQFGDQIEEAIRRRDARGLAQALKGQKEQLGQATRDRDQQASDRAEDTSDRQKEAQERQKEQERQAEEVAARAIEQLQEQTRVADEERNRAFKRQQRDQGIGFARLRRGQARADLREVTELRAQNRKKVAEINRYFDEVESIIDRRLAVGGKLAEAIQTAVLTGLDLIFRD